MGRESACFCRWGARSGDVVAKLEATELTVRGAFRARVAVAGMRDLHVTSGSLRFAAGDDTVILDIGEAAAERWLQAIRNPPTLAQKLGIGPTTQLTTIGFIDDAELRAALAEGATSEATLAYADLAIVRCDDAASLAAALHRVAARPSLPLWVVYSKGRNAPLGEAAVRGALRAEGYVDTKVAAVSQRLTAARFARSARRTPLR